MPYKIDVIGIYKIVNKATGCCYVGQSQRVKKRIREHFRLLRMNKHTNQHLQNAYNKYGAGNFVADIEVQCEDASELDALEEAFLKGDAWFEQPATYNIADFAKAPMRGREHTQEAKARIKLGRNAATFDYRSAEHRAALSAAQVARHFTDPKFVEKVKFIVENDNMSYAERARHLKADISAVRKLAIKYRHLKGEI